MGRDLAVTRPSPDSCRARFAIACDARSRAKMANRKQGQQMIPLITCEISFGLNVSELVFGVNVFDLHFGVQTDSVKQPIKSNSVGSGNMSHCRTSSL